MRKLIILKTCLDFFFVTSVFVVIALLIFVPAMLFSGDGGPIKINGVEVNVGNWDGILVMLSWAVSTICFIYAIFLLRQSVHRFVKREIFTDLVIRNFNRIGWLLLVSKLISGISAFLYQTVHLQKAGFGLETGGFDSGILSIALALFFMVLGEVFRIAKQLKEENDLTL